MIDMPAICFDGVRFAYDGKFRALDDVSLRVSEGEFVCVLGGNGSGKSTLAKHINALLVPDQGVVQVFGRETSDPDNLFFVRSSAGMVFQSPDDQMIASTVEDDVAFGPENLGLDSDELRIRVKSSLARVGLAGFEQRETSALSGGQKQRVAIAGILAMNTRILLLDEASAMLDPSGRKSLVRECRRLNQEGLTIMLVTHFMDEAAQADRVIVLNEGHIVLDGLPSEVLVHGLQLKSLSLDMPFAARISLALQGLGVPLKTCIDEGLLVKALRRLLQPECDTKPVESISYNDLHGAILSRTNVLDKNKCANIIEPETKNLNECKASTSGGSMHSGLHLPQPILKFLNVSYSYGSKGGSKRTHKASAPLQSNSSSAKSALQNADSAGVEIFSSFDDGWALKDVSIEIDEGEFVGIAGRTGSGKSTLVQLTNGLLHPAKGQILWRGQPLKGRHALEDVRRNVGVVFQYPERQLFARTIFDDVAFGPRNLGLDDIEVERRVRTALEMVHLEFSELKDISPFVLSGGQQRRVAIAGILAMRPEILVLDEPTAGLDPHSHAALLQLIQELHRKNGITVIFVSHNMDDLAAMCDRVIFLNDGIVVSDGSPEVVFADVDTLHRIGLEQPSTLRLANQLGIRVDDIPSESDLAHIIADLWRSAGVESRAAL